MDAGPTLASGFGAIGLHWSEMQAWVRLSGQSLTAAEIRLIRRLSQVYASAQHDMRAHDAPAPWPEPGLEPSQNVDNTIGAVFSALAKRGQRG